jgi:hypothetical protein
MDLWYPNFASVFNVLSKSNFCFYLKIHSFTTADALEQFVASRAAEKTLKLSSRLKKARKLAPSFFRDVNSMDASLFVLSAEPYYEDYSKLFFI